jgi:hypothetical protein
LYLSLYFEQHRPDVRVTAEGAVATAQRLTGMSGDHRSTIKSKGRRAGSALRVHEAIKARPILSMPQTSAAC